MLCWVASVFASVDNSSVVEPTVADDIAEGGLVTVDPCGHIVGDESGSLLRTL